MGLILHIDTATLNANICIAKDAEMILYKEGISQNTIEFLHPAIQRTMQELDIPISSLDAVMVHAGPGSYTGLRIGFATVKGICYVIKKTFITASSFDILAHIYFQKNTQQDNLLVIDTARDDEWYFQYFNNKKPVKEPGIKTTEEVKDFIENHATHVVSIRHIEQSIFQKNIMPISITSQQMVALGELLFQEKKFTDIYQSEPLYCKAAYVK
ncbi:MAG: tRNA (adenosine(37)-N6)-threonylcarbamoyltransferase complex dimerization subunit type 1 TsaB [Chitinophagaceae bacterium]